MSIWICVFDFVYLEAVARAECWRPGTVWDLDSGRGEVNGVGPVFSIFAEEIQRNTEKYWEIQRKKRRTEKYREIQRNTEVRPSGEVMLTDKPIFLWILRWVSLQEGSMANCPLKMVPSGNFCCDKLTSDLWVNMGDHHIARWRWLFIEPEKRQLAIFLSGSASSVATQALSALSYWSCLSLCLSYWSWLLVLLELKHFKDQVPWGVIVPELCPGISSFFLSKIF